MATERSLRRELARVGLALLICSRQDEVIDHLQVASSIRKAVFESPEEHMSVVSSSEVIRTLQSERVNFKQLVVKLLVAVLDSQGQTRRVWSVRNSPKVFMFNWNLQFA